MIDRLRAGDLVALVAPSGWVPPARAQAAVGVLTGWGPRIRIGGHAPGPHTHLPGPHVRRRAAPNAAPPAPGVRGILCLRGGCGAQRIVDRLDLDAARADPKLVAGFSD